MPTRKESPVRESSADPESQSRKSHRKKALRPQQVIGRSKPRKREGRNTHQPPGIDSPTRQYRQSKLQTSTPHPKLRARSQNLIASSSDNVANLSVHPTYTAAA
ncbi:hypothetical protein AC578_6501 [Pseudocercospora eumusae]|uniref:Uncharacterized protein n=1 Tax=Pseudocercospora eumusae TaxID=321146 RepID=A0A139HHV3_9PEZI|nr:hypothetical protein AC578_6501 [Pseudocercospora eumusae]